MRTRLYVSAAIAVITFLSLAVILAGTSGPSRKLDVAFAENNLLRLHVIANSDSPDDQALKLAVRDAVLDETKKLFANVKTRDEAEAVLRAHLDGIRARALAEVRDAGRSYQVAVELGKFHFPDRIYGDISVPEGDYDALRVIIGKGEGRNWWCVLFPPLCFVDAEGKSALEAIGKSRRPEEALRMLGKELAKGKGKGYQAKDLWKLLKNPRAWLSKVFRPASISSANF